MFWMTVWAVAIAAPLQLVIGHGHGLALKDFQRPQRDHLVASDVEADGRHSGQRRSDHSSKTDPEPEPREHDLAPICRSSMTFPSNRPASNFRP